MKPLASSRAPVGAFLLLTLAGCGGGGSGSSRPALPNAINSIAFVSTRDGAPEIYVMNPDGSAQTRVTTGIGSADNPSQTRDGRIVFESNRDGNLEIYRVNRDGSNLTRLTNDAADAPVFDSRPAFSPDGQTIAWTSARGGLNNIWLMDSTGANQRPFTADVRNNTSPTWTPDGSRLAFFFDPGTGNSGGGGVRDDAESALEIRNVATRQVIASTGIAGSISAHPRFNADATKIVYADSFRGLFLRVRLYDLNAKTSVLGPNLVANSNDRNRAPDFSPDGRAIVWDALTSVSSTPAATDLPQIYRAATDGTAVTALTTQGANYSPDY